MKIKKGRLTAIALGASALLIAGGTLAFFSAESIQEIKGDVGTVVLSTGQVSLTNKENFNPGDEHPDNKYTDIDNPGNTTPHKLSFGVTNTGTKSIRTRNIIDISIDEDQDLSPDVFTIYEKDKNFNNTDIANADKLEVSKFVFNKDGKKVLRYVIQGVSLNGEAGKLEDKDIDPATIRRDSADVNKEGTSVTYNYYLGLSPEVKDEFQGKSFTIKTTVQAIQYRNTSGTGAVVDNEGDWKTVFEDTIIANK